MRSTVPASLVLSRMVAMGQTMPSTSMYSVKKRSETVAAFMWSALTLAVRGESRSTTV